MGKATSALVSEIVALVAEDKTESGMRTAIALWLHENPGVTVPGPVWAAIRRRLGLPPPPRASQARPKIATPKQFDEALLLAAHVSKLREERDRISTRIEEIDRELLKYKDVVGAMEALKRQVDRVKDAPQ